MNSILFVAPEQEIADTAGAAIAELGISIPVIVAKDQDAVERVMAFKNAAVVISRGGTAADLKVLADKTIVEINCSFNDILTGMEKLFAKGCRKIGVVMRANIVNNAVRDFDFAGAKILVRPCDTYEEIQSTVQQLYAAGLVDGIAGCSLAVKVAKRVGIVNVYVKSGKLSISKAIEEALKIEGKKEKEKLQLERMNAVINNIQEGVIILNNAQTPIFYNKIADKIFGSRKSADWREKILPCLKEYNKEKIVDVDKNKILLHTIPLEIDGISKNEVLIFQEVSSIEKSEQKIRLSLYQKGLYAKTNFADIISSSPQMKEVMELAAKFAKTDSNIIIYGETGTGKEGMAQSIHNASPRAKRPFVSVNCASLPPNLIESELFGYVDGAFTGARRSGKKGLFELAHEGTIFLDEIGELPLDIQSRLLRVLQEREVMRIGDDKILPLDIRVICATNKNLKQLVREGLFRGDLYYRINVLKIQLPALRHRQEDIIRLMNFYLRKYSRQLKPVGFSSEAEQNLLAYSWPGNIRELKNVAEVLAFYGDEIIQVKQLKAAFDEEIPLGDELANDKIALPLDISLKEAQKTIIQQLLAKYSPEEVCSRLAISRVTLWRKIRE